MIHAEERLDDICIKNIRLHNYATIMLIHYLYIMPASYWILFGTYYAEKYASISDAGLAILNALNTVRCSIVQF